MAEREHVEKFLLPPPMIPTLGSVHELGGNDQLLHHDAKTSKKKTKKKDIRGRSHITSAAGGGRGGKPKADHC